MPELPPKPFRSDDRHVEQCFGVIQAAAEEILAESALSTSGRRWIAGTGLAVQLTVKGAVAFEDRQGRRQVLPDFAVLYSHADDCAYGSPPQATEPSVLRCIEMSDCPVLRTLFDRIISDFGVMVHLPEKSEARDLFNEIGERFKGGRFRDRYEQFELLCRMLIAIHRQQGQRSELQDPIELGHRFICNQFRKGTNLKEIAQMCGVTREYFAREFRRRFRQTPGELLKRLRLEHAELLLKTTSKAVIDVSTAAGFTSLNTFGRAFKKHRRQSPSDFRAEIQRARVIDARSERGVAAESVAFMKQGSRQARSRNAHSISLDGRLVRREDTVP